MSEQRITPAQRRVLRWLAAHDGWNRLRDIDITIASQTLNSLAYDRLIAIKYAQVWGSGKRPFESIRINTAGHAALGHSERDLAEQTRRAADAEKARCQHDWEQIELDWQECRVCGMARQMAYPGWQE